MMISVFSNFIDPFINAGLLRDVDQTKISALYEELRIAYNQGAEGIRNTTRLFVPYYEQDPDKFDDDLYYKLRSNEQLLDLVKWFNSKFIPEFPNMKRATIRVRVKIFRSKLQKLIHEGIVSTDIAVKLYLNLVESLENEERCYFQNEVDDLPFQGSPLRQSLMTATHNAYKSRTNLLLGSTAPSVTGVTP